MCDLLIGFIEGEGGRLVIGVIGDWEEKRGIVSLGIGSIWGIGVEDG